MRSPVLFLFSGWIALLPAHATKHHLFVSTFSERSLYALEFDDATLGLTLTANISASDTHTWISLTHDKKALYGSGIGYGSWYSYTVNNASSLTPSAAVPMLGNCISPLPGGPNAGSGPSGLFTIAASTPPYAVYGAGPTCGNVLSVNPDTGALMAVAQDIPYSSAPFGINAALMHGMALSGDGHFLYATDARNSIWTYAVHNQTGELDLVDAMAGPVPESNPRHAATHPKGGFLYVVLEGANVLVQYRVDKKTGRPALPCNQAAPRRLAIKW